MIWYVASPSGPLPSLFKLCPMGQKWPCSGGHIFYRECSGSVVECLTQDWEAPGSSLTGVTALWSLSKTHLPSLVLVQPRKTHPCLIERLLMGRKESNQTKNIFYTGLYRENDEKIFLSETTRLRVLIIGIKHHLVNLYQVCSNYIPGAICPGVTCFT